MRPFLSLPALLLLAALLGPTRAGARTWLVPAEVATIAAGLDSAAAGDTVQVACGTYVESGLVLGPGVTLRSATGQPECVTLDGAGAGRVLECAGLVAGTRLEGLTITRGAADPAGTPFDRSGGGLRCDSSAVEVTECVFVANTAKFGAGAAVHGGSPTFLRCAFDSNAAFAEEWGAGGGLYTRAARPSLLECSFEGNTAFGVQLPGDGGGVFSDRSTVTATDCAFRGNASGAGAGAFYHFYGDRSVLVRCRFDENASVAGGALYVENSLPQCFDCDFAGNVAANGGAAFLGELSDPTFTDCRFDSNRATPYSGGVVDCRRSDATFLRCELRGNLADLRGGAANLGFAATSVFIDCLFEGNSAATGGALRLTSDAVATLAGCLLVGNGAGSGGGLFCDGQSEATVERTLVVLGLSGAAIECAEAAVVTLSCSNLWGNAGGDWVGAIAPQAKMNGNLSADPLFCDDAGGGYAPTLPDSPCLPENNACGQRIGFLEGGCGCPGGATILVPGDHPTIAAALAVASPGDVVGICDGTRAETIELVSGVHLRGVRPDLVRVTPGGSLEAVLVARGITDSTVVEGLTLDGEGVVPQVVLAESASTALALRGNRITGGGVYGVRNGADSRIVLGGALPWANDLFANGTSVTVHLRNENLVADSLDATLNWWGTTRYDSILAMVEGPVRTCPITNAAHSDSLCAPLSAVAVGEPAGAGDGPALTLGPNPFASESRILFALGASGPVRLTVHDVAGRRVRTLQEGVLPAGLHAEVWSARDERGRALAPGVYFVRLEAPGGVRTRKAVLFR